MGLTTERKVFFGLVAVAGAALFIDQGFLGPKGAAADPISLDAPLLGNELIAETTKPSPKPAAAILIDRLGSKSPSDIDGSFGSAFSLTKLIEPVQPNQIIADQSGSLSDSSSDALPMIAPRADDLPVLSSVMPSANGGGAVLGGTLVRVGQVGPNGYKLLLVHARAVLVERDGVQYAIEIPRISGQD